MMQIISAIIILFLVVAAISIIVTYWKIILITLAVFLFSLLTLSLVFKRLELAKIDKILASDVVWIPSQKIYTIPIEVNKIDREITKNTPKGIKNTTITEQIVKSIYPELKDGELEFTELHYELSKVKLIDKEPNLLDYKVTREISQFVKDVIIESEEKLKELTAQLTELNRLRKLALSSKIHAENAYLHERAIREREQSLEKVQEGRNLCCELIKEKLIEKELAKSDPELLLNSGWKVAFDAKYRDRAEQYQMYKDEMKAYFELRGNSQV